MLKNNHRLAPPTDEPPSYWMSFSDIMAGLLVIFILASINFVIELSETQKKVSHAMSRLNSLNQIRGNLLYEMKGSLQEQGIFLRVEDNNSVLRIPESQLYFNSMSHEIPANQRAGVGKIGHALYNALLKDQRYLQIDTIFIEGHTDSRPASSLMGNWGLSVYRAISVWEYWSEELSIGENLKKLKNSLGKPMFSVSGYASTRRIVIPDDSEEKRRKNRRIDIRFTMKKTATVDYDNIKNIFQPK
ncbi:MAG: OmpA family protein [Methylococcales bacterium]|jgi:flagellar motor protein MotB|nr:OmpA family protein [Methylococcales bacterium]MBT7411132.1 OmpA family protein [Methylococcales bacterium]